MGQVPKMVAVVVLLELLATRVDHQETPQLVPMGLVLVAVLLD